MGILRNTENTSLLSRGSLFKPHFSKVNIIRKMCIEYQQYIKSAIKNKKSEKWKYYSKVQVIPICILGIIQQ